MKLQLKIILVETSHPGNIGASARAMKNMGVHELVLVNPQCYPHEDAFSRASGAEDILERAEIKHSLKEAIKDCNFVAAATARSRNINWPTLGPKDCASKIIQENRKGYCAVVFGPEQSGLKNEDIDHCNALLNIPVDPNFTSLNLSMAVQIFCYELRMSFIENLSSSSESDLPLASLEEMENFYEHLEGLLVKNEFLDPSNPRHLMRRIRRLFVKAAPDQNEVNILRGMLSSFEQNEEKEMDNE